MGVKAARAENGALTTMPPQEWHAALALIVSDATLGLASSMSRLPLGRSRSCLR